MFLSKLAASFLALFMPLIIAINGVTISVPFFADTAETEYVFAIAYIVIFVVGVCL
jgi:hypothetical protein